MSFKRPRTPIERSPSSSPSPRLEPTPKSSRTNTSSNPSQRPLLCTLPPTCNPPRHQPTHIANTRDLESHYAMYHAHVCEFQGCGCVFPEARLLELHQTECHDPLAALRKERGEKIFACHLPSCTRLFSNPKTRRLHLIDIHAYPKEYFFAVTNKGIGGLLQKWGEGATMLRGEWKERSTNEEPMEEDASITESPTSMPMHEDDGGGGGGHTTPPPPYLSHTQTSLKPESQQSRTGTMENTDDHLDGLINSMTSLSLVPPSIRFGRGGRSGGFGTGAANGHGETHNAAEPQAAGANTRGGRGRGRGRGFAQSSANGNHVVPAQAAGAVRGAGKIRGGGGGPGGIGKTDVVDPINSAQGGVKNGGRGGLGSRGTGRGGIVIVSPGRARGGSGGGRGRIVPRGRGRGI